MKRILLVGVALCVAAASLKAATFTVTNTNDSGPGSLRQAMLDANGTPGADTIAFNIPGPGVHTIAPATQLPDMLETVTIDGYTQPGSSPNTNATGALNTILTIELDGTNAGNRCVTFGASNSTARGLVINRCVEAFEMFNFFGSNATGIVVTGCFVGTDPSGTVAVPNAAGVTVPFTQGGTVEITVGGPDPADRNLISGNTGSGIFASSNFNGGSQWSVFGNVIGLAKDAQTPLPNGIGINLGGQGATTGKLGDVVPGLENVIAGNAGSGIRISVLPSSMAIRGNAIYGNGAVGIDLASQAGPFPNDADDADAGPNGLQNFPIISSVAPSGGSTHIQGVLHSTASTSYDIDFYANPACSNFPREFLQGQTYIGSAPATTDASGTAVIDVTLPIAVDAGARISATATDASGNTSEFSQRIPFSMSPSSGAPAGGAPLSISGTDILDGATVTVGGIPATDVNVTSFTALTATAPALDPGTVHDVVVANLDGSSGTLARGYVSDFLDVPNSQQFYSFVTTLVSNGITAGVGQGMYGVDQPTLRQQMAVFLMKAKHGIVLRAAAVHDTDLYGRPLHLGLCSLDQRARGRGRDRGMRQRQRVLPDRSRQAPADGRPPAAHARGLRLYAARLRHRDLRRRPLRQSVCALDLRPRRAQRHRRLRQRQLSAPPTPRRAGRWPFLWSRPSVSSNRSSFTQYGVAARAATPDFSSRQRSCTEALAN